MNFKDTTRYQLLELTALCGEFPTDQLYRLIPSQTYAEKVITQLKTEKLLRTHYRDKLRGYRLTKKAKAYLLSTQPERFAFYLTGNSETNLIRSEPTRRMRLHQRAEGYLTILHAIFLYIQMRNRFCFNRILNLHKYLCEAFLCFIVRGR